MTATSRGRIGWNLKRQKNGHRDYTVKFLVETNDPLDGPLTIFGATGLPTVGSTWTYGNDNDAWAFCHPDWKAKPVIENEPNTHWHVEIPFSTQGMDRCNTTTIGNPISEPDRISGSFVKYTGEALTDKDGDLMLTTSLELLRGKPIERDFNRPSVVIEKNVLTNPLSTFVPMIDTLNDATLWGLTTRKIKLSNASWKRLLYGVCTYYYVVRYEFDINSATFDRVVPDMGTKVLADGGTATNPKHWKAYKDPVTQENTNVIYDTSGGIWDGTASPGPSTITLNLYGESNFLLLNIPTTL